MAPETSSHRIELLNDDNYLAWKRRVIAVLRDKELLEYVDGTEVKPIAADPDAPTADEAKAIKAWIKADGKAQSQIELALGDSQMVHIAGAETARAMWEQLRTVKEQCGQHGILALCRRFYRMQAKEEDNISSHITQLRQIQE